MAIRRPIVDEPTRGVHEEALERARAGAARKDCPLRPAVLEVGGIDMVKMARGLSNRSGLSVVETIGLDTIQSDAIRQLPHNIAREYGVLALYVDDAGELVVG